MKDFDLFGYYQINSVLMNDYKYNLETLENMYPWERDIYIQLFNDYMEKKEDLKDQN